MSGKIDDVIVKCSMFLLTDKLNDIDARTAYNKTHILDLRSLAKYPVVNHLLGNYCYKCYLYSEFLKRTRGMRRKDRRRRASRRRDALRWVVAHWVTLQSANLAERLSEREQFLRV